VAAVGRAAGFQCSSRRSRRTASMLAGPRFAGLRCASICMHMEHVVGQGSKRDVAEKAWQRR